MVYTDHSQQRFHICWGKELSLLSVSATETITMPIELLRIIWIIWELLSQEMKSDGPGLGQQRIKVV